MVALVFDEGQLLNVAKAVIKFNKYAEGNTTDNVIDQMKRIAHSTFFDGKGSYVSTYGFVLTLYETDWDHKFRIYASVSDSLFNDLEIV